MFRWKFAAFVVGILGLCSFVGGLIGFLRARSVTSALVGLVTFAILTPCVAALRKRRGVAIYFAAAVALLLDGHFLIAYTKTPKVMPHLIIIVLSSITLCALGWVAISQRSTRRLG